MYTYILCASEMHIIYLPVKQVHVWKRFGAAAAKKKKKGVQTGEKTKRGWGEAAVGFTEMVFLSAGK